MKISPSNIQHTNRTLKLGNKCIKFGLGAVHIERVTRNKYQITSPHLLHPVFAAVRDGNLRDDLNLKIQVRANLKGDLRTYGGGIDYNDIEKRFIIDEYRKGAKNRFLCARYTLSRTSLLKWIAEL